MIPFFSIQECIQCCMLLHISAYLSKISNFGKIKRFKKDKSNLYAEDDLLNFFRKMRLPFLVKIDM